MAGLSARTLVMDWIICSKCEKEFPANVYKKHLREVHLQIPASAAISKVLENPRRYERRPYHRMVVKSTEGKWISSDSDSDYEVLEPEENFVSKEEHEALQLAQTCYEFVEREHVEDEDAVKSEDQVQDAEVVGDTLESQEPQASSSDVSMIDQSLDDSMTTVPNLPRVPTPASEETDFIGPAPGLAPSNKTAIVRPLEGTRREVDCQTDHVVAVEAAKAADLSLSSDSFAPPGPGISSESVSSSQVPQLIGPSSINASETPTVISEASASQQEETDPTEQLCELTGVFLAENSQVSEEMNPSIAPVSNNPSPIPSKLPPVLPGLDVDTLIDLSKESSPSFPPTRSNNASYNNLGPAPNMTGGRSMHPNSVIGRQKPLETRRIEIQPSYSNYRYMCHICDSVFATGHGLASHVRSHNVVIKYTYACSQCKREFDRKQDRDDHLRSHQIVVIDDDDEIEVVAEIPRIPVIGGSPAINRSERVTPAAPAPQMCQPPATPAPESHPCYLCARKFPTVFLLRDHIFSLHASYVDP